MARQITLSETSPGTFQVMGASGDGGNPFASTSQSSNLMQPQSQAVTGYRATLPNGQTIMFASEADYLKADQWVRSMGQGASGASPTLGGSTLGGGGMSLLRTGAETAETVVGFLEGRALNRKLEDLDGTLDRLDRAEAKLNALGASYPDLVPAIKDILRAEREATVIAQDALEDMISAVDIKSGAGAAKVISQFVNNGSGSSSGTGTAVAVGATGLGIGILLNRDSDRRRRRR